MTTINFKTNAKFEEYLVDQHIGIGIIRARLRNKINLDKLVNYNIAQGPFADIAELGERTKKVAITFGRPPPKAFLPNYMQTFEECKYILEQIKKKKASILSEYKKGGKRKAFWTQVRKIVGKNSVG